MKESENTTMVPIATTKRAFDILSASFFIMLLSPIFLLISICIYIEGVFNKKNRGPVFYTETRMSQGKPFTLRKFRIFKVASYQSIRDRGEIVSTKMLERKPGTMTRTGNILKKFYLDELPQLFSVLRGDMSMVGTRPWTPPDYKKEIAKGIYRKKAIKAGITGPVQIHKHDAKAVGGEHMLDDRYVSYQRAHRGMRIVFYDIKILLLSLWFMVKGQGL
ncbi:MAG: hypothetical protein COU47_00590 [Candidatus Niyogibacteria bacterium CG10_big_fil_rev_8_21_14_0_10_46_36]|uniref:Bacterial sugar transferase domain-containing protein n=1 Tax=Candidatus Niyogibacteria bacterium CG10_big_fil_rev_8_21_14_0_10_46_36 TaxID=1974726 RepID=A0A2H0TEE8_9BACT|nr:MAG: hypothetical protein COU47_00590 [Candidatus Niyogibacteria bacterium CG10_big_fil_rev_8_21_14_0_10_46_36]